MKHRLLFVALFLFTLGVGVVVGFQMPNDDDFFALRKNFQIFGAVYEELVNGYVDPLDPEKLMRSGIEAMLEDLDPYTIFIDEADNADIEIITRGRYGGVGLNVGIRDGKITVTSPIEGTSGYKQGVRAGDVIIEIEGKQTEGLNLVDVRHLMRGEPGTAVEITVMREGELEPLRFLLTREQVQLKNVTFAGFVDQDTLAGIGYIKLERFARDAGPEVRRAILQLQHTDHLKGLILDLRDNPGGLLDAAVEITELFVPQGSSIVSTKGRLPQSERSYRSNMPPLVPDLPLVVLVNEITASASEIVAGAIQDLDRGIIVGTTTFGKGLVQIIQPLPYNTSLKLTTSKYYTPSGRSIQAIDYGRHDGNFSTFPDSLRRTFNTTSGRSVQDGRGIEPDQEVSPSYRSELEQALERRAAFFFYANFYAANHDNVDHDLAITDEILEDFQQWLSDQQFFYRTDAERSLEALDRELQKNGYQRTQDKMDVLREAFLNEKTADFYRHRDTLKERLRSEILARYYGESAQIVASYAHDVQVKEAVSILENAERYQQYLTVN